MSDDSRPSTVDSLRTSPLIVCSNSLLINQLHQRVLQEKRREFNDLVKNQKKQYEIEATEYLEVHNLRKNTDNVEYRKLRGEQQTQLNRLQNDCQERLTQLFHRFQREWMMNPVEKDDNLVQYNGSDNGAYIAKAVGRALELGLTEVCQHQPADPIEYLAMWLKSYSVKCQMEREKAIQQLKITLAREEEYIQLDIKKQLKVEATNLKTDERRRKKEYLQRIKLNKEQRNNSEDHSSQTNADQAVPVDFQETKESMGDNNSKESSDVLCSSGYKHHEHNHVEHENRNENINYSDDEGSRASVLYTIQEKDTDDCQEH